MKTPRRTEPLYAPLRDDDGRLLSSPAVCPSCRCRPVRVVAYTNASGEKAYRASTSCEPCQLAAFGGGSAPAAPAVAVAPAFKVQLVQRGAQWTAVPWGKMAPIVRPVPGNTRMAGAATWATQEEARAELPTLCGCSVEVVSVEPAAPISETRPAPRPVVPLTSDETITALAASVERVAAPPSVTARDLSRHAVRMRKAGLPVAELDPHERARLSLSRSHRIGCAS